MANMCVQLTQSVLNEKWPLEEMSASLYKVRWYITQGNIFWFFWIRMAINIMLLYLQNMFKITMILRRVIEFEEFFSYFYALIIFCVIPFLLSWDQHSKKKKFLYGNFIWKILFDAWFGKNEYYECIKRNGVVIL